MNNNLNSLLQKATISLAAYLDKILPSLANNWWKEAVVNILSFQQRRQIKELLSQKQRQTNARQLGCRRPLELLGPFAQDMTTFYIDTQE